MHTSLLLALIAPSALAIQPRLDYLEAFDNVNGGDWYRAEDNSQATLAWGESYVMMSLIAMYRATGDLRFLDLLVRHADLVLLQRDDARGVRDYRGVSAACWQNTHYQPEEQPYCYVVHSGMIAAPLAEYALLVQQDGLEAVPTVGGAPMGDKAAAYAAAAAEVIAAHEDQWDPDGYYVFRPDAAFLTYAGRDLPLNQSNAMGRLLLLMHTLTGEADYLDKATRLALRLRAQLTAQGDAWVWNYWGGAYAAPGEDVSHAAINVDFAAMAAEAGVVFSEADVERFAATFTDNVYVDDATTYDFIGGTGDQNGSGYRPQLARWLRISAHRPAMWAAARDLYADSVDPETLASGSALLGLALLAEHEPPRCAWDFYVVDWEDQGDWRQATAYGANLLALPPDFTEPCVIALEVEAARSVTAQQWDGDQYHDLVTWTASGGAVTRYLPYDPRWPLQYSEGRVLFQLADSFVDGEGVRVREPAAVTPPNITSPREDEVSQDGEWSFTPSAEGDGPLWWSLADAPPDMRIDGATGRVSWATSGPDRVAFDFVVESPWGSDLQSFTLEVLPLPSDSEPDTSCCQDSSPPDSAPAADSGAAGPDRGEGRCGCAGAPAASSGLAWALLLALSRRRR